MLGAASPYVVAICSLMFCGASALTLIRTVNHFDPPDAEQAPPPADAVYAGPRLTDKIAS